MKKILVTGGAGFIGSHIVEELLENGYKVVVLDDFSTGKRENLPVHGNLEIVEGSVSDYELVEKLVFDVDAVSHQAAIVSVPKSFEDPLGTHKITVDGTLNTFEASRKSGNKRVVFASSAAVYGDTADLPVHESQICSPMSPYGLHKRISEQYANLYNTHYGTSFIGLRYFNVFGERQTLSGGYPAVIPIFIKNILEGVKVTIFGDGEQTRDFIYVKDIARANRLALEAATLSEKIINIGCGEGTSLNQLVSLISEVSGKKAEVEHKEVREGDIKKSVSSVDVSEKVLGFKAEIDFEEGIKKTLDFYR